ncbi:hypothetical protein HDF09_000415 [Edaphobacter lichenicola]|uniref:Uncharacterized protein n=1 Tax=Tunturiibacter empetritectus TaxID=3069691 RepID=A0A7W8IGG3_9BACT|nr:hypothetical protein [Edaphobacter lichenicola]
MDRCPAGRASCAEGGHFVTCIPLRLALPLVATENDSDNKKSWRKTGYSNGVFAFRIERCCLMGFNYR